MSKMSDSETDILQNNVFRSQNFSTVISAKGPNSSTNMSFRNMYPSAPMMPKNFERPRYAESAYDQRSVYSRRDVSPTSSLSYYRGGMGSRSVYDRRGGSPMSMRTIDSNTSVSAIDIATAFKTMHFNKYDMRIIKEAYNKFLKSRQRRRIEKRRNRRYMKGGRYRSGGESGEEGSDSSVSSDDCRSTRSYRSNIPKDTSSCRSTRTNLSDFRRTMQDSNMYQDRTENFKHNALKNMFSLPPRSVKESSQSRLPTHSSSFMSQRDRFKQGYLLPSQRFNQSTASQSIPEIPRHRNIDRDARSDIVRSNNHMIQSSLNSSSEQEEIFERTSTQISDHNTNGKRILDNYDLNVPDKKRTKISPNDQITEIKSNASKENKDNGKPNDFVFAKPQFPIKKITSIKNVVKLNSRVSISIKKTPVKQPQNTKKNKTPKSTESTQKPKEVANDVIENEKKTLAGTKSNVAKAVSPKATEKLVSKSKEPVEPPSPKPMEKLISKSKEPVISLSPRPVEKLISKSKQPLDILPKPKEVEEDNLTQFSTTDMSMRPSFIKRKLFSQKTDIADNKNSSSENIETSSPSNVYSAIQKEKNRTRKLVTSQSCLNHDGLGDESNLIDLIHKIVPANQLNVTTATNKNEKSKKPANAKKGKDWDISNVIASCSNDDVSDTFTDEEIFKTSVIDKTKVGKVKNKEINDEPVNTVQKAKNDLKKTVAKEKVEPKKVEQKKEPVVNNKVTQKKTIQTHRTVVEKTQPNNLWNTIKTTSGIDNGYARSCVKSFWDITSDSDMENTTPVKLIEREVEHQPEITNWTKVQKEQHTLATTELAKVKNAKQTKPSKSKNETKNDNLNKTNINEEISHNDINKESNSKHSAKAKQSNTANNKKLAKQNTPPSQKKKKPVANTIKTSNLNCNDAVKNQSSTKKETKKPAEIENHTEKIKINNNTLRIRTCRTPKINRCCLEPSTTEDSLTDTTLYRSLRSRAVNLSTSMKSDISLPKKTLVSKIKRNNIKKKDTSLSDVSFTLAIEDITKRISRTQNNITNVRTRRGDISLTFTPDIELNKTMTRSRNTKTVDLLETPSSRPKRSVRNKTDISISHIKNIPKVKVSKTRK